MNNNTIIQSAIRNLRIGTLLTFIGINLRFVSGNIINALIFFNILKSGNPVHKYDIHAPGIPDMCGDVMMVIVLTIAYLFTQRGNYRQNIFQNDEDRLRYLSWIKKTYLVGTSIGNKGVYCEVRAKNR